MNSKQILEALKMQPLSEEEKSARHILSRLYGPIATCNASTRNGRRYNKELWERALSDDLFKEKIANKSLFLELGHPVNREETDMEKVCACIPEIPKIVNGDLYAYVDILDTNNGKLLKTLCDYGFVPGISSRGSGDIMPNDEVDPETFFLETWDIVQIPAIKDARLQMCESFDAKSAKLKKVLAESYSQASDKEKEDIKEALDNLDITLDSEDEIKEDEEVKQDDIPWVEGDDSLLLEDDEEEKATEEAEEEIEFENDPEEENSEVEPKSETAETVGDFIEQLQDYDTELALEFKPVEIDGKEYEFKGFEFDDSEEDKVVVIPVVNLQEIGDNKEEELENETADEKEPEAENSSEEAEDNGDEEVIESLKEMIRQKDLLEQEIKTLKNDKTVSDTEVKTLKEELDKYKLAFARTGEIAAKVRPLEAETKSLKEQLQSKNTEIIKLKDTQTNTLTESLSANKKQITSLQEALTAKETEIDTLNTKLTEQVTSYEKKVTDRTKVARYYKSKFEESLKHYIDYRASMLGVKASEITNKLDEHYSIIDVDKACEEILNEGMTMSKLPYGFNSNTKIKITESKTTNTSPKYGYEIDDSLLELAGLKK